MKILVTGGAGYIGSHACKVLAAHGHEPIVYDNLSRGHSWAVKWGPFENGNIADTERLRLVFARHRPAAVMHFAAYTYVGESIENPLIYYTNNIAATAALLRSLIAFEPIPVVFSSTAAIYGAPQSVPISEDYPERPINPYGFSKYVIERMLADVDRAHGVRSVSLRYFNAAGADPNGTIGEDHNPETHLVPLVLAAARDGTAVQIYGNDYDTPDGTCIRDYVHVMDIAEAHVRALDYLLRGGVSCTCNLANAHGYSVSEVIKTAERVTGKPIQVQVAPRRAGDPPALIGRVDRAKTILGWSPQRSDLATQIGDAWNWLLRGSRQR
jgi:UDP-arabinose 4-epimerase